MVPNAGWWGSSPLARGLPAIWSQVLVRPGIIPARAGFTARDLDGGVKSRDHPRSRGVYVQMTESDSGVTGSSPLARGLRVTAVGAECVCRIIPARAGFTRAGPPQPGYAPDHGWVS